MKEECKKEECMNIKTCAHVGDIISYANGLERWKCYEGTFSLIVPK